MAKAKIGYAAMLEQFGPQEVVEYCRTRRAAGFSGVMAADHFQPWVPQQGHAAFVWNVMTAIGERTKGDVGPGVTCPTFRMHPGDRGPGRGNARGRCTPAGLARPRLRRGAQRAHRRWLLARDARADRPDVRGDRDHQEAVRRARQGRQARRASSSSSSRRACGRCPTPAAADLHRDRRPRDGQEDRHVRGRPDHRRGARGASSR